MKRLVALVVVLAGLVLVPLAGRGQAPAPTPAPTAPGAAATPRIAFIDLQRVLVRSAAGVAAREQLEKERAGMQKEIDARRQEIEKLREELDKKGALLTAEARREKEELLDRKRRDATRMADDFQRELVKKEQQLGAKVLQELSGVIERVGKQRGYFLIVERRGAGVLYSAPEADLTDEIIRVYDQESASKGGKK